MDLERLSVAVRPRTYSEAIDLGFRMGRHWWGGILAPWLIVVLPVPLLGFVLLYDRPGFVLLAVWWLKPLYDRIPLHVISRAFFGDLPRPGETIRALPSLLRRRLFASLILLRLDPMRAVHMPVSQLEGLRGPALSRRRKVISRGAGNHAMLLMGLCALFELALTFLPMLILAAMIPSGHATSDLLDRLADEDPALLIPVFWIYLACWIGAMSFIEPLFVAAGFALYVNRRTLLEAWDIEVSFRRMVRRLGGRTGRAALLLIALSLSVPGARTAGPDASPPDATPPAVQETAPEDDADEESVEASTIREVLADPVFGREVVTSYRALRGSADASWLAAVGGVLARLILVVVVALIVYVLIRVLLNLAAERVPPAPPEPEPPETVVGLQVTPESLPDDVAATARELWLAGDRAGAVRLLYRASLTHLIRGGLPVKDSATEGDCLRLARASHGADLVGYFERLTRIWVHSAYGHEGPPEQASDLIDGWTACFGGGA